LLKLKAPAVWRKLREVMLAFMSRKVPAPEWMI
jgi:hypothetical protein